MGPQRTSHHHLLTFPKFWTSHIVGEKQQDKNNASKGREELPSVGTSQTPTLESLDYNASRYLLKIIQVTNVKFSEWVIVYLLLKHTWNRVVSESNAVHHLPRFKVLKETGWVIIQVREKMPTLGPRESGEQEEHRIQSRPLLQAYPSVQEKHLTSGRTINFIFKTLILLVT